MFISYNWLKQYVDFDLTPSRLAEALTSIGLETDGVEKTYSVRGGLEGLITAEIVECTPHPASDHLNVCRVRTSDSPDVPLLQVVCGAPNAAAGLKVILAPVGCVLYAPDGKAFPIKRSKLRGVVSEGMLCAEDEIGVGTSHAGIIELPLDTKVGVPANQIYDVGEDYVMEVDITPNRADACSHYGVARDLYAYLVRHDIPTSLHRPEMISLETSENKGPEVTVEKPEACPRYCTIALSGCKIGESPEWLKQRLTAIGLRPLNAVVDVTNYVLWAYGQPLHCFDGDRLRGNCLRVTTMPEGTPFVILDGTEKKLDSKDLLICDAEGPVCMAGVMGGLNSGVTEETTEVVLESAYFDPTWVRKTARRHGISSDSSFRFERGIDPVGQIYALNRAAALIMEMTGGHLVSPVREVSAGTLPASFPVDLSYDYADELIGKKLDRGLMRRIVEALEMKVVEANEEGMKLSVPSYRVDVQRPCDVVEDILRIYGYNHVEIPSAVTSCLTLATKEDRKHRMENLLSEQLVGEGYREIMNNSLTREAYYTPLKTYAAERLIRLLNPLSSDLGVMRQSLLFGGLETIARNMNRQSPNLRLFECGNCYCVSSNPELPADETRQIGLWLTGKKVSGAWAHADEPTSFYVLKATVMNLLRRAGLSGDDVVCEAGKNDLFAQSLAVKSAKGVLLAELGAVRSDLLQSAGIKQAVYYAELSVSALHDAASGVHREIRDLPRFPAVSRDLALLVDKGVEFAQIVKAARGAERKLLKRVELFDVYEGKELEAGKKSYAVNFVLQDEGKTMNDRQTDAAMKRIFTALEKEIGAKLR